MGTSIKTVVFATTPYTGTVANNTLTTLTSPTIYLPESSKVFRSCWLRISCDDIITATGGSSNDRRVDFGLGAVAQTTYQNTSTLSNSGENISLMWEVDVTAYFAANWSGTSMTTDIELLVNQTTGTTLGQTNVCVSIHITYEYDDTSATQVKTVWLPLDAPVGALATSKPGSPTATIPALDTHCPEASKTYRQIAIWRWGNTNHSVGSADTIVSMEIESDGASTCAAYESALGTARHVRYIDTSVASGIDTSATQAFYIWADQAVMHHPCVMMMVTYEFDASTTTGMIVSVCLPADFGDGGFVGSSGVPAVAEVTLWIQEADVTAAEIAFYCSWGAPQAISPSMRIGEGSYTSYTDGGTAYAGDNAAMIRDDDAYALARGRNTLKAYAYTAYAGRAFLGMSGFFVVNYQCTVPDAGISAANKTVESRPLVYSSTLSEGGDWTHDAYIPEAAWYASAHGHHVLWMGTSSRAVDAAVRAAWDDWRMLLVGSGVNVDAEVGAFGRWSSHAAQWFQSYAGGSGIDPKEASAGANWYLTAGNTIPHLSIGYLITYHSITYSVAGEITGSNGGTATIDLHRASDGELLATTSRVGDGAFSLTWYDNTEDVFVSAYEDDTHVGRSAPALAGT